MGVPRFDFNFLRDRYAEVQSRMKKITSATVLILLYKCMVHMKTHTSFAIQKELSTNKNVVPSSSYGGTIVIHKITNASE